MLKHKPLHARGNFLLSTCHLKAGTPTQALAPLLRALTHAPNQKKAFLHYGLALARSQLKDVNYAKDLKVAFHLAVGTQNTALVTSIGMLYRKNKLFTQAIPVYVQLIAFKDESFRLKARKNLATCYRRTNQLHLAKEQYILILHALKTRTHAQDTPWSIELIEHWCAACSSDEEGTSTTTNMVAPESFVRGLYDGYAQKFDEHLLTKLAYQTPTLLCQALLLQTTKERTLSSVPFRNVCDLGCGTGLMMVALLKAGLVRPSGTDQSHPTAVSIGIDLSSAMVDKAREKQLYDVLHVGNMNNVLVPGSEYDLVCCCDVYPYVGDLDGPFRRVRNAMVNRVGGGHKGYFVFSTEEWQESGAGTFKINSSGRFLHSIQYVEDVSQRNSFDVLHLESVVLRMNGGKPVHGLIGVLQAV